MLNYMRQNANSWVMILLFAIIIFVFAINFGPWAGQPSEGKPYAAIVNNKQIPLAEFRSAYVNQFTRIKQFRPDYDESQSEQDGLKSMVLEQLVSRELLTQLGQRYQLSIGAVTLAHEIKDRVFGPDANFDKEEYKRRVNGFFQTSIAQFEELVAKELVAQQMINLLGTPLSVSDNEAKSNFIAQNTKVAVEFVKIDPAFYKSSTKIGLEKISAFIEKNQEAIAEYYNAHISQFNKEKQVQASHILIKIPSSDSSAEEKSKLKARAQAIADRIKKGEDFASIARAESEDLGTKEKGGDLGFFSTGQMVEEFANAAFSLNINQVSEVIETPFGFHIIKVTDKMDEQKQTLAQATPEIAETLIHKAEEDSKAKAAAEEALAQLRSGQALNKITLPGLVYGKSEGSSPMADESNAFNRNTSYVAKIGKADTFIEQAFKLTKAHESAAAVFAAEGQFYAIRLKSREDADMSKFVAEKESIKNNLLYPRRRAFMQQYITSLKEKAKISYNQELMKQNVEL